MNVHELKCWPYFYGAVADGSKTAELRYNDRDFRRGDLIWLREWVAEDERGSYCDEFGMDSDNARRAVILNTGYTGAHCFLRIKRVDNACIGLRENYALLSIERVELVAK